MARIIRALLFATLLVTTYAVKFCESDNDCTTEGCGCSPIFGFSVCTSYTKKLLDEAAKCEQCRSNSDCDFVGCTVTGAGQRPGRCMRCVMDLLNNAMAVCSGIKLVFFHKDSDCGSSSCKCALTSGSKYSVCTNMRAYDASVAKCKCSTNTDCPKADFARPFSQAKNKICLSCIRSSTNLTMTEILKCNTNGKVPIDTNSSTVEVSPIPEDVPDGSPIPQLSDPMVVNISSTETPSEVPAVCVSTAWLFQNGLADAILRHGNYAPVLCIPGLPCGTHGHLLRDMDSNLVSYREVCEHRSDCVASVMRVSQLSHSFNWSNVISSDGKLSLTSLSVMPDSKGWSASRIIAKVADGLNKAGLGLICNKVAYFALHFRYMTMVEMLKRSS